MSAGRPKKYVKEFHAPWAKSLARRGLTVKEIADEMNVARSTFYKWVAENEELSDSLNEGRGIADSIIEDSLYKRARGMTVTEKKTIVSAGADGEQKPARVEVVERDIPPDVTACIFWLKNRNPNLWRDATSHTVNVIDQKTREEVASIINGIEQKKGD